MQSINAGFQNLKALIPHSSGEKLSKACILQRSADYMQYLSNEKDKITNKLQIAIKLIESNGLLSQLQAQINLSLAETNQNHATSTTSVTKSNRNQKQTTQDNTNCSNQNQTNETSNNEKSNTNTKIANISTTPASVASNRKSFSSSPSASFYGSPDRNETKVDQQTLSTPIIDETSPSSVPSTISNPLSSIINLKGKTIESVKINTASPNNKEASPVAIETANLTNIDNNDQNLFTIKSQLLNEEASNMASNEKNTATLFSSSTSPNSNVICRQLSDTTNIISFSDNSLIVLNNNNNSINNTLNANAISNNTQITTSSVQLNLNPNETTSCSFSTNADLKGNNSNLFACGGTLIQSLNPIGCLSSLQHSHIIATANVPNSNEQTNTVTNNNANINSKQIQLEFDNSKKISNLLRCTDLLNVSLATSGSNINKKHIKQMVQMGQPTYAPPLNQVNQTNDLDLQKVSSTSHIQISNADLVKLIEYKVKFNTLYNIKNDLN